MAKKTSSSAAASKTSAAKTTAAPVSTTPVRNTTVPPKSAAIAAPIAAPVKKAKPSHDTIALAAYYIWKSSGGSEFDNWISAERKLSEI